MHTVDELVLVVDAGSSSLRCHLVDANCRIRASASRAWTYLSEPDASEFALAFDLNACWRSLRDAVAECISRLEGLDRVSVLTVTSQRQSLVFLDADGGVLYAGPNRDLRAVFDGSALDLKHGPLIYRTTGHRPTFMMAAGKLRWLLGARPESYDRLAHVVTLADWFCYRLTGDLGNERTLASGSGLVDIGTRRAASELFADINLKCPLPAIRDSWEVRGLLAASDLPDVSGVPVVVAGADTQCGLIGLGSTAPGDLGIIAGWSGTVQQLVGEPVTSVDLKTWTGCFHSPGIWALESSAGEMGNTYQWLSETLFGGGNKSFQKMSKLADAAPASSEGIAAFLGPQRMDVSALGMRWGGLVFPVPMALGGPSRGQLVRAAIENFAYALRINVEQAERVSGRSSQKVGLGGGLTRSRTFSRIVTDVLGRQVEMLQGPDSTAVGAALVARTAIGEFNTLDECVGHANAADITVIPDPLAASEYDDGYQRWLEIDRTLRSLPL